LHSSLLRPALILTFLANEVICHQKSSSGHRNAIGIGKTTKRKKATKKEKRKI